jgi:hypothetical protein
MMHMLVLTEYGGRLLLCGLRLGRRRAALLHRL